MNNMKTLIGFEYKKLIIRKSTWTALAFLILMTVFSCFGDLMGTVYVEGKPANSHYEEFITNRSYARALSGREINEAIIGEMQEAYKKVPDVPLYSSTEEYQEYARPYSSIYQLVRNVSKNLTGADGSPVNVFEVEGSSFYKLRDEAVLNILKEKKLNSDEMEKHLEMNKKVVTPFVFEYADGYDSIMSRMYTIGVMLLLTLAICLTPVFANEFSVKTDQLILTSKYGKSKAVTAKLITGISFGFIVSTIILLIMVIPTLLIYGFDGWNAQLQLLDITTTYPLSVLEGVLILCGMVLAASLLITSLSLFLSARLKSAFSAIVVIGSFIIICMFFQVSEQIRFLYQAVNALPLNIMSTKGVFSYYFYIIADKCFTTYQVIPFIYGIISIVLLVFSYRCFKNHQIST